MSYRISLLSSFLYLLLSIEAQVPSLIAYPLLDGAHTGILVKELHTGCVLTSYQNDKSFVPASVMKLITTATCLSQNTPSFRYSTSVFSIGEVRDSILYGDIVIKGGGDPTLGSQYFYDEQFSFMMDWSGAIRENGIKQVNGAVIVDASIFDKKPIPDKWIWEDIGNYYGAGCYGLSCFDNRYVIDFSKTVVGDIVEIQSITPAIDGLEVESFVRAADNNRDNAYIYGSPWSFTKQIYGTIPANRSHFRIKGALPNPPLVLAQLFRQKLSDDGVAVIGGARVSWEGLKIIGDTICSMESPLLADIIRVTNKESNNLFAEHLLKTLSVDDLTSASLPNAIRNMMTYWEDNGIPVKGVKICDGSGLSRANLLTPDFVVGVLRYMLTHENAKVYTSSLAIAGYDGTFKYFLDDSALSGKALGKSGSMSGVRCYAGVVNVSSGRQYVFSCMVNNFTCSSSDIKKQIEAYLLDLFRDISPSES